MKKYTLAALSLLAACFIYVFYRTEKTIINQIVISLLSHNSYLKLKAAVTALLPLNDYAVYSLPEGLWVFSITITSGSFYLELSEHKWSLQLLPIVLAILMEVFQLLHITNGYFDIADIFFAALFWFFAILLTRKYKKEPLFHSINSGRIACSLSYTVVYMAHVVT